MSALTSPYRQGGGAGNNTSIGGIDEFEFDDDRIDDYYYESSSNTRPLGRRQHGRGGGGGATASNSLLDESLMMLSDDGGGNSDTDEASEAEFNSQNHRDENEPMEIKEQMYQDKLASLKRQLNELKHGNHPEYVRRVKKLDAQYRERLRLNEFYRDYLMECVDRDYGIEKRAASKEYEEKRADLKENLLTDFEDKRKQIEAERHSMELAGDTADVKPTVTRKLRRRPNDPVPVAAEKRRKPTTGTLVLLLDEKDIDSDLKLISRGKAMTPTAAAVAAAAMLQQQQQRSSSNGSSATMSGSGALGHYANNSPSGGVDAAAAAVAAAVAQQVETRIEDGKLLYERRWYHRGQPVYVEGKDVAKFAGTVSAIGNDVVWVKKLVDNSKVKINTFQLARGKLTIKRRAN